MPVAIRVDGRRAEGVETDGDGESGRAERIQQSIKVPRHLRQRLRLAAVFLERQISEMVEEAVVRYLDDVQRERKQKGLAPIPEPAPEADA